MGKNIAMKEARAKAGLSQQELADRLGVSRQTINAIEKGDYNPKDENSFTPALVNRIDRNTGGIVIAAKNAESLRILNQKLKDRELEKYYLCVVHGKISKKSGMLTGWLSKDEKKNKVYVYDKSVVGSKEIRTKYKVLKDSGDMSLLEIELLTGRTHQIRVQCASRKMPLLGDEKYGSRIHTKNIALWSNRLAFDHPVTKKPIDITLDPPKTEPWIWFNQETLQLTQCSHCPY